MTLAAPGVLRRKRTEGMLLTAPIGTIQRHPRDHGRFVVDAVVDKLAGEREQRQRRWRR